MNFKNNVEKVKDFTQKRLIEVIGILLLILSILIFVALISYSPTTQILFILKIKK